MKKNLFKDLFIYEKGKNLRGSSGYSPIGAVVGATYPEDAVSLRNIMSKRNQHYVPQFHLRQWSDDGKLISIYNKKNKIFVSNKMAISNFASKKYLYDKDGSLENILSEVEYHVAPIYKKIIDTKTLDGLSEDDIDLLYLYLVLCNERTVANGDLYEKYDTISNFI